MFTKTNDLETQLINKGQEITKAQEDMDVAEEKKQQQYEDMKLRIKYMYEEGDTSALERIVASGSISEMLTQTEYGSGRKILQKVCSFRYHCFPQQNRRKELHQHEQIRKNHSR